MLDWASAGPVILASFLASLVECVEALTIVLAVGIVRGWRSALLGTATALLVLTLLVVALGQSLTSIPLPALQAVVGTLLLMFGFRWLRKAVLRAAGVVPLHDEEQAYAAQVRSLGAQVNVAGKVDKVAFVATFKSVMLEGIEVVFIVIAIGASGRLLVPAMVGAVLALLLVVMSGFWLHRPLANVPENALKFIVGVLLAGFGTFWIGEGIGLAWPGEDWAIAALIVAYLALALILVRVCRKLRPHHDGAAKGVLEPTHQGALSTLWHELIGLFVDDGMLAVGIVLWVVLTKTLHAGLVGSVPVPWLVFAAGCASLLSLGAIRGAWLR